MKLAQKLKNLLNGGTILGETSDEINNGVAASLKASAAVKNVADGEIEYEIIGLSDASYLVSKAARICVGQDAVADYEERLKHVSRVIGRGHESTLEHTNLVVLLHFNDTMMEEFIQTCGLFHFLNFHATKTDDTHHVLMGGSLHAYKQVIRRSTDPNHNSFIRVIKDILYCTSESVFYEDFISDGVMEEGRFVRGVDNLKRARYSRESTDKDVLCSDLPTEHEVVTSNTADVLKEHTPFENIFNAAKPYMFTLQDCMDMAVITVVFHDISRTCSMQLNRHRNAISQESQRYVNYAKKSFIDPMKFTDKPDLKYKVSLFDKEMSSQELGDALCKVYGELIEQGMLKQEARSYLPSNVYTKEMMTFTIRNLFHFLWIRKDKAAQNEIRFMSVDLEEAVLQAYPIYRDLSLYEYLFKSVKEPAYHLVENTDEESVDEVIEESVIENESSVKPIE